MKWQAVIRGRRHEWIVTVDQVTADAMRADGIEVVEIVNTVPEWVARIGMARVWCAAQDIWNLPSRWWR